MGCFPCIDNQKSFHIKILLLDKQELIQEVRHNKTTGQDLLDNIFQHLNLIETAYFGLRYQDSSNQTVMTFTNFQSLTFTTKNHFLCFQHWLDPNKRVSRQIRSTSPVTLYLGVKFYAADPCRLVEEITRYQFFLQVKLDVLQGRLPVTQELAVELAAMALQCKCSNKRHIVATPPL